jgi:hypothetical protein
MSDIARHAIDRDRNRGLAAGPVRPVRWYQRAAAPPAGFQAGKVRTRWATTSIASLAAALSIFATSAGAEQSLSLRGLFCTTESQLYEVLRHMQASLPPQAAVAITNRKQVGCVYADRIDYVVTSPVVIAEARFGRLPFVAYRATLTGVRVGGNLRPIEPAISIFLARPDRIEGLAGLGGA